jgi:hypothetical protein
MTEQGKCRYSSTHSNVGNTVFGFNPRPLYLRKVPMLSPVNDVGRAREPVWMPSRRENLLYLPGIDHRFFSHAARSLVTVPTMLFHCSKDLVTLSAWMIFRLYKNKYQQMHYMKMHFHTILHHITRHVSMLIHHLQGYILTIACRRSNVAPWCSVWSHSSVFSFSIFILTDEN